MTFFRKKYPSFLSSETGPQNPETALFHVIPCPMEISVSGGHGTSRGPLALLRASQQLEVFDGISSPADSGIFTHDPLFCRRGAAPFLGLISREVSEVLSRGKIPVLLGGEHTVTVGALYALLERNRPFGIVQFDAHADLRDEYQGSTLSHACVMKRVLDSGVPFVQFGVRSLSPAEDILRKERNIVYYDAREIHAGGVPADIFPAGFPDEIYLTFDVDGLDPSLMPSTGTPEPGGLLWPQAMRIIEKIAAEKKIVGFDVVELAPIDELFFPDFTAARLVYNIMGFVSRAYASSI